MTALLQQLMGNMTNTLTAPLATLAMASQVTSPGPPSPPPSSAPTHVKRERIKEEDESGSSTQRSTLRKCLAKRAKTVDLTAD